MGLRKLLLKGLRFNMPLRIPFSAAMTIQSGILLLWNGNFQYAYAAFLSLLREFQFRVQSAYYDKSFGAFATRVFRLRGDLRKVDFEVTNRKLRAWVPDDSIFFSMKDVLFNREYELFPEFELKNSKGIVVDVGAHAGLYSLVASCYAGAVLALEPDDRNYEILSTNLAINNLTNVTALKCALWVKDGHVTFYPHPNSHLSSIRRQADSDSLEVKALSLGRLLDTALSEAGLAEVDLLKLDIEGAESEVFASSDFNTFNRVSRIVVEVHVEWADLGTLTKKLKQCGFDCIVLKRPFQKRVDGQVRVLNDYRFKLLMKTVNSIMRLSRYNDKHSLLLFASKNRDDFSRTLEDGLKNRVVDIHEYAS